MKILNCKIRTFNELNCFRTGDSIGCCGLRNEHVVSTEGAIFCDKLHKYQILSETRYMF
jgi:hypothetical protein